jgi:hypothetical protein
MWTIFSQPPKNEENKKEKGKGKEKEHDVEKGVLHKGPTVP